MPQQDMSLTEAARLIGLHPETMRRLAREGKIETYRVNPSARHAVYRVTQEALASFRERGKRPVQKASPAAAVTAQTPQERAQAFRKWVQSHAGQKAVILDDRREALYQDGN